MNRALVVPALGCFFAFAALVAFLHGAAGREASRAEALSRSKAEASDTSVVDITPADAGGSQSLMSLAEAERKLTALSDDYLRPWRRWENSPERLYSRVGARQIPTISAEVAMEGEAIGEREDFLLATIAIRNKARSQDVACVVDRNTQEVRLFSAGQWLSEDQWLKQAPVP
jgi:hypothetical protein